MQRLLLAHARRRLGLVPASSLSKPDGMTCAPASAPAKSSEDFYAVGLALWLQGRAGEASFVFNSAILLPDLRDPGVTDMGDPVLVLRDYRGYDIYFGRGGYYATRRISSGFRKAVRRFLGPYFFEKLRALRNAHLRRMTLVSDNPAESTEGASLEGVLRKLPSAS